jgi:TorA maturation chaperone TorD
MTGAVSKELGKLMQERGNFYGLLARLYREEVDAGLLDQIDQPGFFDDGTTRTDPEGPEQVDLAEGKRVLRRCLQNRQQATLIDLAVDYARIFLGVNRDGAYPYESVYTSPGRLIMQDARDDVLAIYRQDGLARSEQYREPEDHISFELEYMAHQCLRALDALDQEDLSLASECVTKQRDFMNAHLLPWVPAFCADIHRLAQSDFYQALAYLTTGFLSLDAAILEELVDVIKESAV